jgi:hypothetical protein
LASSARLMTLGTISAASTPMIAMHHQQFDQREAAR